jgi:hypothetical protein
MQDHIDCLRKPLLQNNDRFLIVLLNSLFKRLVLNEGVMTDDDLYRPAHSLKLGKIRKILRENLDVRNTLKTLAERRP